MHQVMVDKGLYKVQLAEMDGMMEVLAAVEEAKMKLLVVEVDIQVDTRLIIVVPEEQVPTTPAPTRAILAASIPATER